MKKLILVAMMSGFALSAHAECKITSVRSDEIGAIFKKYGGWTFSEEKFNQLCAKLKSARARIQIAGMASVLNNNSIGWASLSVLDFDTGVASTDFNSMSTQVNGFASQDKANELMVAAINSAAEDWNGIDKALASLQEQRKKARANLK
ncbi:hypothetical protein [Cupriavidus sp. TMH.W2]|uniref:hypothetical protein n=1 Tax=Cupriavidus sp. TMH.W2 TaxID=3434465 RepID=UPI003D770F0B